MKEGEQPCVPYPNKEKIKKNTFKHALEQYMHRSCKPVENHKFYVRVCARTSNCRIHIRRLFDDAYARPFLESSQNDIKQIIEKCRKLSCLAVSRWWPSRKCSQCNQYTAFETLSLFQIPLQIWALSYAVRERLVLFISAHSSREKKLRERLNRKRVR